MIKLPARGTGPLVTLLVLGLFAPPLFAETASTRSLPDVFARLVARNDGHGGGVARIAGPSAVIWQSAVGLTAGPGSAPMTVDTPFEIASITKAVTAATILRLVEDGKLRLDSTLGQVLPDESRGFNPSITIRQLLSHTSGLPDYWTDGPKNLQGDNAFIRSFDAEPGRTWRPADTLAFASKIPAKRPGSRFHYSDTNYVLLGRIIERTTGQPLQRVFRTTIFDPLGMNSTWLTYHEPRRGAVPSHRYEDALDLTNVPRQSADWAGGGLVSTTRDLERLLRGLASGRLFHRPGTLSLMRDFVPVGEDSISYGLGLYRVQLDDGLGELWGHDGHANSFAYYWPQRDTTFTGTLNQLDNDWWPLVEAYIEGESAEVALADIDDKTFDAFLATGYDSLYMYRGVNSLHDNGRYGTGLYWTELNLTWNITENDFLTFDAWNALGLDNTGYREFDTVIAYTRMIQDFALTFEYDFFYGYGDAFFYSHELALTLSRDFDVHGITLSPSLTYNYNLGPDSSTGLGTAKVNSSFLLIRLDGNIPLYHDIIALAPWTSFGLNFNYNTRTTGSDGETSPFTGANNFELGVALPIKVNKTISLSGYVAYSHAFTDLPATEPDTFWAGASVTFSY